MLRGGLGAATSESNGHEPVWGGRQYVHILLLGLDRRDNEPTRSDTMILATVNLWDGAVSLLSIPRDLLVPIPDHGEDRINTAFAYGQAAHPNDPAAGPALAVKTVSRQFNVPIEHYLFVDFAGFREIVDASVASRSPCPRRLTTRNTPRTITVSCICTLMPERNI